MRRKESEAKSEEGHFSSVWLGKDKEGEVPPA